MKNKFKNNKKIILSFLSGILLTLIILIIISMPYIQLFVTINGTGYYAIQNSLMQNNIFKAMANSTGDKYTTYYDQEEAEKFKQSLSSSGVGLGVRLATNTNPPVIAEVFEGSPAKQADVQIGDKIIKVDGTSTAGMGTEDILALIKGNAGDVRKLTLVRENQTIEKDITLKEYNIPTAYSSVQGSNGILKISSISENTTQEVKNQIEELENQNITGLVIDLRNNPGGYLNTAVDIINLFTSSTEIPAVITEDHNKSQTKIYADKPVEKKQYPITILVNEDTASAAEVITIALRDLADYQVIGTKTFGKGSVQGLIDFRGGILKLTQQIWLGPNGEEINDKGIEPDIQVTNQPEYLINPTYDNDLQLQKAIEVLNNEKN